MGSFNETCALSGINIGCGDPVKLLFLTQNPYLMCDQHEAKRGCYHYDQWFCRTPPITGKYDDYGRAAFKDGPIPKLIAAVFDKDTIERPFGHNQYHAHPVTHGKGLGHYIEAAWDGRLLVTDDYGRDHTPVPDAWPTWERVHEMLRAAQLKIMGSDDSAGYNAQPVLPGIVCVHFNSYNDNTKKLKRVEEVLAEKYDTKLVLQHEDNPKGEMCLIVTAKGAFKNTKLLHQGHIYRAALDNHPENNRPSWRKDRQLPVLAVMVRQDVWDVYCTLHIPPGWRDFANSVGDFRTRIETCLKAEGEGDDEEMRQIIREMNLNQSLREVFVNIPFMTMPAEHLKAAAKDKKFKGMDDLVQSLAELARVEFVLATLNQAWHVPALGGQDTFWEEQKNLFGELQAICQREQNREERGE